MFATASGSWSGDTANFPGCFLAIVSGSEGSWTFDKIVGGAGSVSAGVQRVTLANDDPAVSNISVLVSSVASIGSDLTTIGGYVDGLETLIGTTNSTLSTINGKIPALGQALAAASVPIVLTASQLTALTPPAAITGFSTESTLSTLNGKVTACNTGAVTVSAALPAGTNAIGKLAANDGVDIGDVTINNSTGAAAVNIQDGGNSITVDGSVSVSGVVAGTSATSLGKAEDSVAADGDTGVMMLAVRKDTAATTVGADGDYHPLEVDANGRLYVLANIASAQTLATVTTVGTVTTCSTVTNLAQLGGAAIAMGTGTRSAGTQRVTIATDDVVPASQSGTWTVGISAAQTLATVTTVGTVTTCSTVTTVSTLTGSGIAHDGVDSGNPHKIGARATTSLSGLTLVSNADRSDLFAGVDGVQIVRNHTNLEDIVTGVAAITDGSSTSVIAAAGSGVKVYITEVIIANSSATAVTVDLRDGTAGSVKATFMAPAGGGAHKTLSVPIPFSANTAVAADPSASASTVTITLVGFKSKV